MWLPSPLPVVVRFGLYTNVYEGDMRMKIPRLVLVVLVVVAVCAVIGLTLGACDDGSRRVDVRSLAEGPTSRLVRKPHLARADYRPRPSPQCVVGTEMVIAPGGTCVFDLAPSETPVRVASLRLREGATLVVVARTEPGGPKIAEETVGRGEAVRFDVYERGGEVSLACGAARCVVTVG